MDAQVGFRSNRTKARTAGPPDMRLEKRPARGTTTDARPERPRNRRAADGLQPSGDPPALMLWGDD